MQSALEQLQRTTRKGWTSVGERLRGMADDVAVLCNVENAALSEARHGLEQARAEFERAAAPVVVGG
ncbi:hypothetical protein [Pantoea stewartii]|uniref:hypothetical protein n=1 Tax=Pantoea stewartii TaxID=66269 RepID=UPI0025A2E033|nr:hypothetical protein [Pantoea stewartii]